MAQDLIALIKTKQGEITKLQGELNEAFALLAGKPSVSVARPAPTPRAKVPAKASRPQRGAQEPRPSSDIPKDAVAFWAAKAIRDAGHPLHVRDIMATMERTGHKVKKVTLVGSLSRWVSRRVFYRAKPNTFGLAELRGQGVRIEKG